jgi:hypothetical protein
VAELQELRREAASSLIVTDRMPGANLGVPGVPPPGRGNPLIR